MPILKCRCGEKMSFSDAALRRAGGKGMNCPECGQFVRLPKVPPPLPESPLRANSRPGPSSPPPITAPPSRPAEVPLAIEADDSSVFHQQRTASRRSHRMAIILACTSLVMLFLVAGIAVRKGLGLQSAGQSPVVQAVQESIDPDRAAVHAWLRANLNDPNFQEVKWWPTRKLVKAYQETLKDHEWYRDDPRSNSFTVEEMKRAIAEHKKRGVLSACKIRYRAKNAFGAWVLEEGIFVVHNGRVKKITKYDDGYFDADLDFPE